MPAKSKAEMLTRAQQKSRQARQDAKARRACTDQVWGGHDVQHGNCAKCRRFVLRSSVTPWVLGHVHEKVPRSLGGDPADPENTELLCFVCHQHAHGLKVAP